MTIQDSNITLREARPKSGIAMAKQLNSTRGAQAFGSSASSNLSKERKMGTFFSEQMVGKIFCYWDHVSHCGGNIQHLSPTQALET